MRYTTIAACLVFLALTACSTYTNNARNAANSYGMRWEYISAGDFDLATAWKGGAKDKPLYVYIEGDGRAYLSPETPSSDPTPSPQMALNLATKHPWKNAVAYLARPCQYALPDHNRNCSEDYWTDMRFSPEVVTSSNRAIDTLKMRTKTARVVLVGYSGGGAVAILAAAKRNDVDAIITVAGNLDTDRWTKIDNLSPLEGSLNPADFASMVAMVPQVHFSGERDESVPTAVVQSFMSKLPPASPAQIVTIPKFNHECCWVEQWRELLKTKTHQ